MCLWHHHPKPRQVGKYPPLMSRWSSTHFINNNSIHAGIIMMSFQSDPWCWSGATCPRNYFWNSSFTGKKIATDCGMNVWFIRQSQTSLFLWFQQRNYYIKINHAMILHAILQHCGVPGGHFDDVLHILSGVKVGLFSQIFHCAELNFCVACHADWAFHCVCSQRIPVRYLLILLRGRWLTS